MTMSKTEKTVTGPTALSSTEILARIDKLKGLDSQREIFGAGYHKYQLNPCLDEKSV